jgi:hypothetical protein
MAQRAAGRVVGQRSLPFRSEPTPSVIESPNATTVPAVDVTSMPASSVQKRT